MQIKRSKAFLLCIVLFLFLMTAGISSAAPQLEIDDRLVSVYENELLIFTVSATDDDINATITYSISGEIVSLGANIDPTTGVFSWTPVTGTAGMYIITFIATANGETDEDTVTIIVRAVNKNDLINTIDSANAKIASAVPGNEIDQYPQSAITAFQTAINTAQAVADNTAATQSQVDQAVTNLQAAKATFDASRITTGDTIPPSPVTNLQPAGVGTSWIYWTWTNPNDTDFSYVMVYIDGLLVTSTSNNFYNATGLPEGTVHTIDIQTVDTAGNINTAIVTDQATTNVDTTSPAPVTNLKESALGFNWIKWTWTNPTDTEFSHVKIYIDGKLIIETYGKNYNYYVASGLTEGTSHIISIQTIDVYGNINPTFVNDTATTSTVNENINVELVNRFGGYVEDVEVAGNYAYLGQGCDFVVIDITDASNPTEVGRLISKSLVSSISISGNYAYLVDSNSTLRIVDIADPTTPTLIGSYNTGGKLENVAALDNYIYLTDSINGLLIVDVSNPLAPTPTAIYDTAGSAYDIALSGNYAYIISIINFGDYYFESQLEIVDITNTAEPTLVGSYTTTSSELPHIFLSANNIYLTKSNGLEIVDVSNPSAPNLVYESYYDNLDDVTVSGNYAFLITKVYMADEWYTSLLVLDITNPSSPQETGTYETVGYGRDVAVSGNYVYMAGGGNGLLIFDVTDPSEPKLSGSHFIASDAYDIDIFGNYAYLSDGINGLEIFFINDSSSIELVGRYHDWGHVHRAIISGNYAYVVMSPDAYGTMNYLEIVDISNPILPTLASRRYESYYINLLDVSGNYAYISGDNLDIIDITNPSVPTLVGSYNYSSYVSDGAVEGNYAYIASEEGLEIVDISIPSAPTPVGIYNPGSVWDVIVEGNYAYIASEEGLEIVDISIPSAPTPVGTYLTGGNVAAVSGNYAYIKNIFYGNDQNYLEIVDISIPSSPKLMDIYTDIYGYDRDIAVSGNYVYVVDNGLSILRVDTISDSVDYPPIANAGSDSTVTIGSPVTFDGGASTDDKGITTYSWDFDVADGINTEATGIAPSHSYAAAGTYTVTLTVTDTVGQTDSDTLQVVVSSPTTTITFTPDYDNRLRQSSPNTVLSSSNYIDIGRLGTTSYRDVLWFNLSGYNPTDSIFKATLSMYWYYPSGATRTSDTVVEVYRPEQWDPNYVTWNSRMSGTPWTTAGGNWYDKNGVDQGTTPYASVTFPAGRMPDNKYYEFDVTQLVQEYVSGTKNTGFFLKAQTEGNNYIAFYSSEWPNADQRPKLTITTTSVPVNNPPIADAGSDQIAITDAVVTFNGSDSTDDKGIVSYSWDFDAADGISTDASGLTVTTTYATAGNYTVTLTVTDTVGQTDSDTLQIVVTSPVTTTTVSYTPDYDNRLRQSTPNTVLSSSNYIDIGRLGTTSYRDVMWFDLSGYDPNSDTVSKATLSLNWYYPSTTRTSDTVVEVYRPEQWDSQYVTWNTRMPVTPWVTAGGSWYDKNGIPLGSTPYASITFSAGTVPDNKYCEFDVTQLVQEYVSGTHANTGFFLKARTESGNYIAFYSSEYSNADQRPKLTVTSTSGTTPTDIPPVAEAGADKTATAGSDITFNGGASTDDKGIVLHSWDFGDGTTSTGVTLTHTYIAAGNYTVTLTVTDTGGQTDTDTLQVTVSSLTNTVTYTPDYDNRLRQSSPNTVYSSTNYLDIGRLGTTSYRDVMWFNLSGYTPSDTISKATLSLYWYYPSTTRTSDTVVEVYRPLEWSPQYVTWNSRMSGMLWDTAGGNWFDKNGVTQGTTPYALVTFPAGTVPDNRYYEFDVTQLVQEYVSGNTNTGFFLKSKTEGDNYIAFYSSDWPNADQRPKLTVTSS